MRLEEYKVGDFRRPSNHCVERRAESFLSCRTISLAFDVTLSSDQIKTLDEASRIELGFPHDLYPKFRAITYGGLRDQILA